MRTLIRNFFSVLRRFKMATTLNILGLSIAFAAFMIILMQLNYDWSFDKSHKNADCIYRVERTSGDGATVPTNRPLADIFFQSSPHIKAGALVSPWQRKSILLSTRMERRSAIWNRWSGFIPNTPTCSSLRWLKEKPMLCQNRSMC